MRVLISANGPDWDAIVVPTFEAAPYWLLVDPETDQLDVIPAAKRPALTSLPVDAVITGHVQAATYAQATEAGIPIYSIPAGGIRIACDQWKRGRLKTVAGQDTAAT